jgi:hypothetical protein
MVKIVKDLQAEIEAHSRPKGLNEHPRPIVDVEQAAALPSLCAYLEQQQLRQLDEARQKSPEKP